MPTLHTQFKVQGKGPDGKIVDLSPAIGLHRQGPVIRVAISPLQSFAKALVDQGKPMLPPKVGLALIDTGASSTCIDQQLAQELQIPVIDVGFMGSASHEKTPCNIYSVQIQVGWLPNSL